ncbi:MAG TPA: hypothetical protein VFM10_00470 [Terriglobales bacterium]|nr:hypothetical protein [Terriglobales bacterium]
MSYDHELEAVRAPLYGIGGLLGVTMMILLFAGFPEIRWFCLFSLPLGIVFALIFRYWHRFLDRRSRHLIWRRGGPHFHWPQPIS